MVVTPDPCRTKEDKRTPYRKELYLCSRCPPCLTHGRDSVRVEIEEVRRVVVYDIHYQISVPLTRGFSAQPTGSSVY